MHTSGGFCFPTTRSGQSRSRVMRQRATWRLGEPPTRAKGATTLQTHSQKKGQIRTSPLFASPRQLLLVRPWSSKRHVGRLQEVERHQGCCATIKGTAPVSETQAKAGEGDCCAAGQVSDWLSPIFPSRFSQDTHLDPRTFRGHSLQGGKGQKIFEVFWQDEEEEDCVASWARWDAHCRT